MDSRSILPLLFAVTLYGCEDTETINDSLTAQNELLAAQNLLLEQQAVANSITLTGSIFNLSTDEYVESANITYKVGTTWNAATSFQNGEFEINGLPSNSYIEIKIESLDGSFETKVVNGHTYTAASGETFQSTQEIYVDSNITYSFGAINEATLEPIPDLTFEANYSSDSQFNQVDVEAVATYNSETSLYEITLPANQFYGHVFASLDTDGDNLVNYYHYWSSSIYFPIDDLSDYTVFQLTEVATPEEQESVTLDLKISVVDESLNSLQNANVFDDIQSSTYNSEIGQHELTVDIADSISLLVPSFEENEQNYSSSALTITHISGNTFTVRRQISSYSYSSYEVESQDGRIDLVMKVEEVAEPVFDSPLTVVLQSETINENNLEYKIFFSSPIELVDGGISLSKSNNIEVIQGNESTSDLILPGTTSINNTELSIDFQTNLSLNNTLLTLTSNATLAQNSTYEYTVKFVTDAINDDLVPINSNKSLYVGLVNEDVFDINDIILDNHNYKNDDTPIITENTAGQTQSYYSYYGYVYMYVPDSVESLEYLSMKKMIVTEEGSSSNTDQTYTIVNDGQLSSYLSFHYTYQLAPNENTTGNFDGYYISEGTTLPNGFNLRYGSYLDRLSDDTSSNENSITFEYAYQTKSGEIHTGTITLPVQ